jgi:RHS repeat-associated protein
VSRRACLLAVLLVLASALRADDHPNTTRGFAPEKAFAAGDIDSINVFNGNTTVAIPIGGSYPVGGNLSYGLTLVYNSSVWDFQEIGGPPANYQQSLPQRNANAGLGWLLTLGRLMAPYTPGNDTGRWLYLASDGSEHVFYRTLHDDDDDDPGDNPAAGGYQRVSYSRDGSYLRMKILDTGLREVELPNGQLHHFDAQQRIDQIRDRFGNAVNVQYTTAGTGVNLHDVWKLTDTHQRIQEVHFLPAAQSAPYVLVDHVDLTSFAGTATYGFIYETRTIARGCPHTDPGLGANVAVKLLTGVSLPDGSSYSMPVTDYNVDQAGTGPGCRTSGVLLGLRLPTWGRLQWTYQDYVFPDEGKLHRRKTAGVQTRTTVDAGGSVLGIWSYATSLTGTFPNQQIKNTVTDPLSHFSEHYFMAAAQNNPLYGLPFTQLIAGAGGYLSTKTYAAGGALERTTYVRYETDKLPTPTAEPQDRMNVDRREIWSRTVFDDDGGKYAEVTRSVFDGLGHYRVETTGGNFGSGDVRTTRVEYNPGRGTYRIDPATNQPATGHDYSEWPDSAAWVLGTFDWRRVDEDRTEITRYCFNAGTGFLEQQRTLYLRVPPTTQNPTPHDTNDLLVVYTPEDNGNSNGSVKRERFYGGDAQNIPTTSCSTAGLPAPAYQIDHTYSAGVRATSQYLGTTFLSLDQTIHGPSGLPSSSRDVSGLQTSYEYDSSGRLTWIMPQAGDGYTEYVYAPAASATVLANVLVQRRGQGQTATVLAKSQVFFDALGRVAKERQVLPTAGESWNLRETRYDAAGNRASISERQAETGFDSNKRTQFLDYDPFGRATKIRPADGSVHDVTVNCFGARVVERIIKIRTAQTGSETAATTTETYDRQGRLWKVAEPSGAGGASVETTYSYDAGNRLNRVQTTSGVTQNRVFIYDLRGLLISEEHPEKGTSGNGKVSYPRYDARGHVLKKIDPFVDSPIVDDPNTLAFVYDAAERLTAVRRINSEGELLKSFDYATANAGANGINRRQGKLEKASRYNFPFAPNALPRVRVVETYTYEERQGRVSEKQTQMFWQDDDPEEEREGFMQSYDYNVLGDVSHIEYPVCTLPKTCSNPAPRGVDFAYTKGRLTSIPGFVSGITYHPNGLYNQITHVNNVIDTQANDPNAMPRPASLSAQRSGLTPNLWSTGTYGYDGAGNVATMGGSYFLYDKVSRVVDGHVYDGPTGGGTRRWQTYTFDAFGNLTNAAGDAPAYSRSIGIDPSTNRLNGPSVQYDDAGNQLQGASPSGTCETGNPCYEYDDFNMMRRMRNSGEDWRYMYTADDERFWSYRIAPVQDHSVWTLRDLDGKVLREYDLYQPNSPARDYVYRDGQLVASSYPGEGVRHFSLDHLGTPRLVTSSGGYGYSVWAAAAGNCKPAPADYDGDGDTDLSLKCGPAWHFYNADGSYLKGIWTGGTDSETPVPADYDGDGDDDVVAYKAGAWHFYDYTTGAYHGVWTGETGGCIPAPADYDGDLNHTANLALKCGGAWHFYNAGGTYLKGIWTGNSQLPVPGDYDGDGDADVVTSDGAAWTFFDYSTGAYTGGVWTGTNGTPMPMDYDGDGTTDITVFANGSWHVLRDNGSYEQGITTASGVIPLQGNFAGDPTDEPVTYTGGTWSIYSFAGMPASRHHYLPFGEELGWTRQDAEQMKFTGHERDLGNPSSVADDLDYMHARYFSSLTARFLSTDSIGGVAEEPQSFNLFSYAISNPLKYVDPYGLWWSIFSWGRAISSISSGKYTFRDSITVTTPPLFLGTIVVGPSSDGIVEGITDFVARGERLRDKIVTRALSDIPIQDNSYGDCVREYRADPAAAVVALGSALPKRLVPPFRVPYSSQPYTTPASVAAHYVRGVSPGTAAALRTGGRAVSKVATPLTIGEGLWDWVALTWCAF